MNERRDEATPAEDGTPASHAEPNSTEAASTVKNSDADLAEGCTSNAMTPEAPPSRAGTLVCHLVSWCLISTACLAVFLQTRGHDFVNYDDNVYVTTNPHVATGLSWTNLAWAFSTVYASNWHPLTWLSHMADCSLYGIEDAGPHHITSVVIHLAAGILLFEALAAMTALPWAALGVALLFILHPQRVESVAWVAERKAVLGNFFWAACLLAYAGYVRRPNFIRYIVLVALFLCGLMAKQTLVTLPGVLFLLDVWPLRRGPFAESFRGTWAARVGMLGQLVREKVPLLLISGIISALAIHSQQEGGSLRELDQLPLTDRVENAAIAYVAYLWQFVIPRNLAVYYPHAEGGHASWQVMAAIAILLVVTVAVVVFGVRQRYLWVGWFWYLGVLVPMIGIVQVGSQSRADRYTDLPMIGIGLMLMVGAARWLRGRPRLRPFVVAAMTVWLGVLGLLAWRQTAVWRDSVTLFQHALASTQQNEIAHFNLAVALRDRGQKEDARRHYQAALAIRRTLAHPWNDMGLMALESAQSPEDIDQAIEWIRTAVRLQPRNADFHFNLGSAWMRRGEFSRAIYEFRETIKCRADHAGAFYNLGVIFDAMERPLDAEHYFSRAYECEPDSLDIVERLADVRRRLGENEKALHLYRKLLAQQPNRPDLADELAWLLATKPNAASAEAYEALTWARMYVTPARSRDPRALDILAAALARAGQFPEAIRIAEKAVQVARQSGQLTLAEVIQHRLRYYERSQPFDDRPVVEPRVLSPSPLRN